MKEIDPNFTYKESQEHYITHSVLQIGTNKIMIAEQAVDCRTGSGFHTPLAIK